MPTACSVVPCTLSTCRGLFQRSRLRPVCDVLSSTHQAYADLRQVTEESTRKEMPDAHRRAAQWRFRCNARNQRPSALVCSVMVPVHLFSAYSRPSSVGSTSGRRQLTITSTTVLTIIPRARSAVLPMLVTMSSSCPCRMSGPSALTLYTTFRCAGYTCPVAHPSLTTCSTVRMSILASGASRRILYWAGRNRRSS